MADAMVVDARDGLPGDVIGPLRRADRIMLAAKGRATAVLGYWRPGIAVPPGQSGEGLRVILIRRGGQDGGPRAAESVVDVRRARRARPWRRLVELLRAGDVLTLEAGPSGEAGALLVSDASGFSAAVRLPTGGTDTWDEEPEASVEPADPRAQPGQPPEGAATPRLAPLERRAADRFDRLTERARKVLQLAQEEAQRLNHNYVGTEHLLLGLVREGEGVAAKVLANLGVELNKVRSAVEFVIGRGDRTVTGDLGLTPRAKKVAELAVDEARRLHHDHVGTEHLLLGLVREGEGIAAGVLESLGVSLAKVRAQVLHILSERGASAAEESEGEPPSEERPT